MKRILKQPQKGTRGAKQEICFRSSSNIISRTKRLMVISPDKADQSDNFALFAPFCGN
jgi:hypothetical protein